MTFQNTLLKYREEKHGDSKMKQWTSKILGGIKTEMIKIGPKRLAENNEPKLGAFGYGFGSDNVGQAARVKSSSNLDLTALSNHYKDYVAPQGKPIGFQYGGLKDDLPTSPVVGRYYEPD